MLTLNDGRDELWQWDTGRTLSVDADCSQVHFSNKVFGRSIDVDVTDGVAIIPDVLLQTDNDLNVWAFVGTADNGYTKISKTFKVNRRNKPADYVFTPTDQMTMQTIQRQIGDLADLTTEAKDTLVAAINEVASAGDAGSMALRVADGYIQYSTDSGSTWQNLIAVAELKGADGSKGDPGIAGQDGHSPVVTATKSGKTTTISVDGTSYAATLTAKSGYTLGEVTVKMGEVDITATAYNADTGVISIAAVTGNVVITANATKVVSYHNLVPTAVDSSGESAPYTDGKYIGSSGAPSDMSGFVTTGFIPFDGGASHVYRIGGDGISWNTYGCRIAWYKADFSLKGSVVSYEKIGTSIYYPTKIEDANAAAAFSTDANVSPPHGAAYFRVSAKGRGENLIITLDELIE